MPPPPANQIIYVKMDKPLKGIHSMDAIWAYGTIFVEKNDSGSMGASRYTMKIDRVEPYKIEIQGICKHCMPDRKKTKLTVILRLPQQ
jgi:hypothetical protein